MTIKLWVINKAHTGELVIQDTYGAGTDGINYITINGSDAMEIYAMLAKTIEARKQTDGES